MQISKSPSVEAADDAKLDAYVGEVSSTPYVSSADGENAKAQALDIDASTITPEELKQVLRKIDLVIMPLLCVAVLLQFLDKTSLNYASLLGLKKDTNLKGQEYSWLGSFFYVGYLVATPIHGFFLQKMRLPRYVAICIVLWAISLGAHAACKNYGQLLAARFFLGVFEGSLTTANTPSLVDSTPSRSRSHALRSGSPTTVGHRYSAEAFRTLSRCRSPPSSRCGSRCT